MQWTSHCVPWQIDFVGVLFGLWPRFLLFLVFCRLLRCFRWRNASLAGGFAGRRVWLVSVVFVCCFNRFACSNGHDMSLYKCLSCLCSCKDRAFYSDIGHTRGKKIDHPNSIVGDLHPIVDPAIPLGLDPELAKIVVFPMLPAIRHGVRLVAPGAKTMDWDLQARDC